MASKFSTENLIMDSSYAMRVPGISSKDMHDRVREFFGPSLRDVSLSVEQDSIDVTTLSGKTHRIPGPRSSTVHLNADAELLAEHLTKEIRSDRMLRWLVLKLSSEELKTLGVIRAEDNRDPQSYTLEELLMRLAEEFDLFAKADDRLLGSIERRHR